MANSKRIIIIILINKINLRLFNKIYLEIFFYFYSIQSFKINFTALSRCLPGVRKNNWGNAYIEVPI